MLRKSLWLFCVSLCIVFLIEYFNSKPPNELKRLQEPVSVKSPHYVHSSELTEDSKWLSKRIVGVNINGISRAYVVESMVYTPGSNPLGAAVHVVNDSVDEKVYAVTYCDLMDCIRVFEFSSKDKNDIRSGIDVIGFENNSMMLAVNGDIFPQNQGHESLVERKFGDTTLGDWLEKFPNTEIYFGPLLNLSK